MRALEPPYRSRGEAQLGRFLRRYNIPFLYEPPVSVYHAGRERVWHPDFVLPTHDDLIVEYAGMPDRPEYMRRAIRKQRIYQQNGRESLFLYPYDLRGRQWPRRLYRRLRGYQAANRTYFRR